MAKNITAEDVAKLWAERGANSTGAVRAGVNAVQEAPTAKAAAKADFWLQQLQRSKDKYVNKLNAVTLNDWKQAMLGKGIANMTNGYNDAQNQRKFLAFMRQWLPYVREGAARVRAMPKNSLQDSINRAAEMIRHNARWQGGGGIAPPPRPIG